MEAKRRLIIIGDLAVLLVAFIWGATNVVIRDALGGVTPFWFCFTRFVVASVAVMLVYGRRAFAMPLRAKAAGTLTGMAFSLAYLAGAVGLLYTTAGNQSFIISMDGRAEIHEPDARRDSAFDFWHLRQPVRRYFLGRADDGAHIRGVGADFLGRRRRRGNPRSSKEKVTECKKPGCVSAVGLSVVSKNF